MMSQQLVIYSILLGGICLAALTLLAETLGKHLKVTRGIPDDMIEPTGLVWLGLYFIIEFLFLVVVPSVSFSFFHVILPLTGIRTGLIIALCAFTLGAAPLLMNISLRIKLPLPYLLYQLLVQLIKLGAIMGLIGYLHSI